MPYVDRKTSLPHHYLGLPGPYVLTGSAGHISGSPAGMGITNGTGNINQLVGIPLNHPVVASLAVNFLLDPGGVY